MFKFRSGTHGLNEELGRHRGREGKTESSMCRNECENVIRVLWECSAYSSTRASFMTNLQGKFSQNGKFGPNGKFSQNGKFGQNGMSGQKGPNVSSSAYYRGCMVNGSGAMCYGSNMSIIIITTF